MKVFLQKSEQHSFERHGTFARVPLEHTDHWMSDVKSDVNFDVKVECEVGSGGAVFSSTLAAVIPKPDRSFPQRCRVPALKLRRAFLELLDPNQTSKIPKPPLRKHCRNTTQPPTATMSQQRRSSRLRSKADSRASSVDPDTDPTSNSTGLSQKLPLSPASSIFSY